MTCACTTSRALYPDHVGGGKSGLGMRSELTIYLHLTFYKVIQVARLKEPTAGFGQGIASGFCAVTPFSNIGII